MKAATDTRTQIIDKASELMMQHGVNGFSYRDISSPLGVKNAAIHYHFPSKNDLIRALIEEQHDVLRKNTAEFMAYGGSATQQLEGLFSYTLYQCRNGRPVCVLGVVAADYDQVDEDIKSANGCFAKELFNWLVRVLEVGREQEEFDFRGEPKAKAISIGATVQGARQLFRIHGEDYLQQVFAQIRLELGIKA
ncbi:MAG TPA: TetR/AcrR family transcriptional regulator [Xanthomonadales bacterium]|nr:TetR/AcrR family transcriptional regulator [Xanthomonadales bacterium]